MHENGDQLQYLAKDMQETMCTMGSYAPELKKKVALVNYFRKYMNEHLLKVYKFSNTITINNGQFDNHLAVQT